MFAVGNDGEAGPGEFFAIFKGDGKMAFEWVVLEGSIDCRDGLAWGIEVTCFYEKEDSW